MQIKFAFIEKNVILDNICILMASDSSSGRK